MSTVSANPVPLQHPGWELWLFAPESAALPTGLRMPLRSCGHFVPGPAGDLSLAEGRAVTQSHRLAAYLKGGRFGEGLYQAGAGMTPDDLREVLDLPAFLRGVGADPARVLVSAERVPDGVGESDSDLRAPWEAGEYVGGPDDDDDSDDSDLEATALERAVTVYLPVRAREEFL